MVIIGLIALWLGDRCNRARDQRRALEAVARSGGSVCFDWEPALTSDWISPMVSKPGGAPPAPEWLRRRLGDEFFQEVVYVRLGRGPLQERDFEAIGRLGSVRGLNLHMTRFDGAWLVHLRGLAGLRGLGLAMTAVGDDDLEPIARLPMLEDLTLHWTKVGDDGVAKLGRLRRLRILTLSHTRVTDRSLGPLGSLIGLEDVSLNDTGISPEGAERLRRALPRAKIEHSESVR
jgi:hypothetical protein